MDQPVHTASPAASEVARSGGDTTQSQLEARTSSSTTATEQDTAEHSEQKQSVENEDQGTSLLKDDEKQSEKKVDTTREQVDHRAEGGPADHLPSVDRGEKESTGGGRQTSSSGDGEKVGKTRQTDHLSGEDGGKKQGADGSQVNSQDVKGDGVERSGVGGDSMSEGGKVKKAAAVSAPTSVVTPPPKQPKNLKVCRIYMYLHAM